MAMVVSFYLLHVPGTPDNIELFPVNTMLHNSHDVYNCLTGTNQVK